MRNPFTSLCRICLERGRNDYKTDAGAAPGRIYKADNGEIYSGLYVLVDEFSTYLTGVDAMQSDQCIDYDRISRKLFIR